MHSKNGDEGLTLIELMVAMVLLAFAAVAGLSLLIQGQKAQNFSRVKTMATNAAEQQLETIFRDAPSNVLAYNNITFPVQGLTRPGGADAGLITVSGNQPHDVTVSVIWQGQGMLSSGDVTLNALRSEAPR